MRYNLVNPVAVTAQKLFTRLKVLLGSDSPLKDSSERCFPIPHPLQIFKDELAPPWPGIARHAGRVGRKEDIVQRKQRVVGVRRFLFQNIKRRAGKAAFLQGSGQRCLINHRTATGVYQ